MNLMTEEKMILTRNEVLLIYKGLSMLVPDNAADEIIAKILLSNKKIQNSMQMEST